MGTGTLGQVRASRSYFGAPVGRGAVLPRPSADLAARQSVSRQHFFLIDTHPHGSRRRRVSLYGWATCLRYLRFFCSSSFIAAMLCSNLASISSSCRKREAERGVRDAGEVADGWVR